MPEWGNSERIEAINIALSRLGHDQIPIGLGFHLRHSPASCARCRAHISILELSSILAAYEDINKEALDNVA